MDMKRKGYARKEKREKRGRPEERKKGSEAGVSREEMQNLR